MHRPEKEQAHLPRHQVHHSTTWKTPKTISNTTQNYGQFKKMNTHDKLSYPYTHF